MRQVFVTWLRENTDCPEVLKSAAHAMKCVTSAAKPSLNKALSVISDEQPCV